MQMPRSSARLATEQAPLPTKVRAFAERSASQAMVINIEAPQIGNRLGALDQDLLQLLGGAG